MINGKEKCRNFIFLSAFLKSVHVFNLKLFEMHTTKLLLMILFVPTSFIALGQSGRLELFGTAGDSYTKGNYQLDWSIGELQTESYTNAQNMLSQGFHQGTFLISDIGPILPGLFEILAYPNPTADEIHLKIDDPSFEEMQFELFDFNGKVLQHGKITGNLSKVDFIGYAAGLYLLNISQNKQIIKSFKILKY
jgi:hypothetical protein